MLRSASAWMLRQHLRVAWVAEQVREPLLRLSGTPPPARAGGSSHRRDLAVLGLEHREQARLARQARQADGVVRGRPSPAGTAPARAGSARRGSHRALDLGLEVAQIGHRGGGDVRNPCAIAIAAGSCPGRRRCPAPPDRRRWWRCAPSPAWPRSAARRCSCRPRCRSRCRARRRCARTCPTGSRSRCRWCRRRRPARARAASWRPFTRSAAMPADRGGVAEQRGIHGSCHDVSGYGVENTSRQPVALAAISWLFVARIAASIA